MITEWWQLGIIVAGLLVTNLLTFFLVKTWLQHYVKARTAALQDFIRAYVEPSGDDGLSEAGRVVNGIGASIGAHLASNMKAALMGMASGESRQAKAQQRDMAQAVISEVNPLLGAAVSSTPIGKMLGKNADVMGGLAQWLISRQGGDADKGNNTKRSNFSSQLSKYN